MTLIAALAAIALNRFLPQMAEMRHTHWLRDWTGWLDRRLGNQDLWKGAFGVLLVLGPPVAVIAVVQAGLDDFAFGLFGFLFAVIVLIWTWGPRDLDSDVSNYLQAARSGSSDQQRRAAAHLVPGELPPDQESEANTVLAWVYLGGLERWFGVLFWFCVLGPMGAVLYRLSHLLARHSAEDERPAGFVEAARRLRRLLDWPVCLLMALGLAIVGHFDAVIGAWRDYYQRESRSFFALDPGYLLAAARATLAAPPADWNGDESAVDTACQRIAVSMNLMWRVLFVWLTVLALCTIVGWLA